MGDAYEIQTSMTQVANCALLVLRTADKISDVFQWCRKEDVSLVAERASYLKRGRASLRNGSRRGPDEGCGGRDSAVAYLITR